MLQNYVVFKIYWGLLAFKISIQKRRRRQHNPMVTVIAVFTTMEPNLLGSFVCFTNLHICFHSEKEKAIERKVQWDG